MVTLGNQPSASQSAGKSERVFGKESDWEQGAIQHLQLVQPQGKRAELRQRVQVVELPNAVLRQAQLQQSGLAHERVRIQSLDPVSVQVELSQLVKPLQSLHQADVIT